MNAQPWGAGEWVTAIVLALGMVWIASKILGAVWWLIRAPFVRVFHYFVDERVFAGVNPLEEDEGEAESAPPRAPRFTTARAVGRTKRNT